MKTIENKTIYRCGFCTKYLLIKSAMERHEVLCSHNPNNFTACAGCAFIQETTITIQRSYADMLGEESYSEDLVKAFKCNKLNKMVYPPKAFNKGIVEKYPETFENQEQMPKECNTRASLGSSHYDNGERIEYN